MVLNVDHPADDTIPGDSSSRILQKFEMNGYKDSDLSKLLLISANVGSLFENVRTLKTRY